MAAQERNLEHFREWSRLDEEFHLAVAEMSGNPALIIARPDLAAARPGAAPLHPLHDPQEHATRYHRRIIREIEAGDPDTAAAMTRRHVSDFRTAWEKAGLDFHLEIAELAEDGPGVVG